MENKPMSFILIEDNEEECLSYQNYFLTRDDIRLVATANSSEKGIEYVQTYIPDAIILDIELNIGRGSGIQFLNTLKNIKFDTLPLIAVITHIFDPETYNYAHMNGANFVIYKLKEDYSPQLVVEDLFALWKNRSNVKGTFNNNNNVESIAERRDRISSRIHAELNKFSMPSSLKGKGYIHDAILYDVLDEEKSQNMTASQYITIKHNAKSQSNITNNIQTAIEHAWDNTAPEELKKLYPIELSYKTIVPTPTQFISYISNKIKTSL
ncbi:MAG: response regulator [Oscillospiraceae bacterium]|nr:response regulator [Oscillospiraceae bacterium]